MCRIYFQHEKLQKEKAHRKRSKFTLEAKPDSLSSSVQSGMSSTIFYKFLHQKVQSTIHFDGTGISVFDLKFEIIQQNHLGDGSDFNLLLYHLDQPDVEYDNDQDVIRRSSFVLARRSPSLLKHGKFNNASRYVSGKPRIQRKQLMQMQLQSGQQQAGQQSDKPVDENISEEDRIKQMFENQTNAWAQTQDELSTHKVVYNKPSTTTQAGGTVAPEDMPPPGYMCYRCGGKDHWIRNCPTNTDPNYEGKKIKRTTGIPRSHLKTISKEAAENSSLNPDSKITTNENGDLVDAQGNIYMITDSGEYVIAVADSKTWMNYQQKQTNAVNHAKHEYELKVLECVEKDGKSEFLDPLSSTKKLLRAPVVMTPCCQTKESLKKMSNFNYNQQDLEQLLIDNDFRCPNCDKDEVYLDALIKNEELMKEMEEYMKEKEKELGIENPETATSGEKRGLDGAEGGDAKRQNLALPLRPDGMPHTLPNGMPMPPFIPGMPPMPMFMPPIPPPFMPPNK